MIKKRKTPTTTTHKIVTPNFIVATSYDKYREAMWGYIDHSDADFHGSCYVGGAPYEHDKIVLQPKKSLWLHDVWQCGSLQTARTLARYILQFEDVTKLKLEGRWVWVDYDSTGKSHILEGQQVEERFKIRG